MISRKVSRIEKVQLVELASISNALFSLLCRHEPAVAVALLLRRQQQQQQQDQQHQIQREQ